MNVIISFKDIYITKNMRINRVKDILIYENEIEFIYYEDREQENMKIESRKIIPKRMMKFYSVGDFNVQKKGKKIQEV